MAVQASQSILLAGERERAVLGYDVPRTVDSSVVALLLAAGVSVGLM